MPQAFDRTNPRTMYHRHWKRSLWNLVFPTSLPAWHAWKPLLGIPSILRSLLPRLYHECNRKVGWNHIHFRHHTYRTGNSAAPTPVVWVRCQSHVWSWREIRQLSLRPNYPCLYRYQVCAAALLAAQCTISNRGAGAIYDAVGRADLCFGSKHARRHRYCDPHLVHLHRQGSHKSLPETNDIVNHSRRRGDVSLMLR